jgi:hypothetical protein
MLMSGDVGTPPAYGSAVRGPLTVVVSGVVVTGKHARRPATYPDTTIRGVVMAFPVPPGGTPLPLRPSATEDAPRPRRSNLRSITVRIPLEQICDIQEIEVIDPDGRRLSDIVRDALTTYLPSEKARLRVPDRSRLEQVQAETALDRSRADRFKRADVIAKLDEEVRAYIEQGTPEMLKYAQRLIDEQRAWTEKMPADNPWRGAILRAIDDKIQPLLAAKKPRTLHLIKDRYVDEDEADRLRD